MLSQSQASGRVAACRRSSAVPFQGVGPKVGAAVGSSRSAVLALARYKIVNGEVILTPEPTAAAPAAPAPPPAPEPAPAAPAPAAPELEVPESLPSVDSILDASSQAAGALSSAAADVTDAAADLASGATEALSDATEALTDLTSSLTSSVTDLGGSLTSSVSGLGNALGDGLGGLTGGLEGLTSSVGGGVEAVSGSASQAAKAASDAVGGALSGATSALSETASVVGGTLDGVSKGAAQALGQATGAVSGAVQAVTDTTSALVLQVEQAVGGTTQQLWSSLPPEAQGVLVQVGEVASSAAGVAAQYPLPVLGVAGALAVPAVIQSYQGRFGGYAGELSAEEVRELLAGEEPALLLDIRPEVVREKDGLPELKLGARFKAAALPLSFAQEQVARADAKVLRAVGSKEELVLDVHAAFVAGLKQVATPLTKVVVLDRDASDAARDVARALRRGGLFSAYVLQDGFKGWVAAELPVTTERGVEYDASAADLINDNVEVLATKVGEVATELSKPSVGIPVVGGAALLGVAVWKYETSLQVIGLAGLGWSAYSELSKYDSPQAALEAWTSGAKKLLTPKPKPVVINGKVVPEGFVPPKLPPPPAAARAEEVLARAAQDLQEAEASRKAELAAMAAQAVAEAASAAAPAAAAKEPAAANGAANGAAAAAAAAAAKEEGGQKSSSKQEEGSLEQVVR